MNQNPIEINKFCSRTFSIIVVDSLVTNSVVVATTISVEGDNGFGTGTDVELTLTKMDITFTEVCNIHYI